MNLNNKDRKSALESLRIMVTGVPIKDDDGKIVGYIERPNLDAIKFVLQQTEENDWAGDDEESG